MGNSSTWYKVKKSDLKLFLYAISAAYFANNGGLSTALFSSNYINIAMQAIFIGIPIIELSTRKTKLYKNSLAVYLLCFLMFAITLNRSGWSIYSTVRFASILLFCFYVASEHRLAKYTIRILIITYCVYAFFTFFEFANRSFYASHIMPLFDDTAGLLRSAFSLGYMAGITSHQSSNGMFLSSAILIVATRYLAKKSKIDMVLFFVFFAALLLTGKRGHTVFIVIALYCIYYLSLTGQKASRKLPKIIGIILLSLGMFFVIVQNIPSLSIVVTRMQNFLKGDDTSTQIRLILWKLAIDAFKSHPLIGIGWHQFYSTLSYNVGSNRGFETHNVYLQLLCETGIVGFTVYLAWFLYILGISVNMYKKIVQNVDSQSEDKFLMGFALAFQLFFVLYCFTGNPLYDWKMNVPYFMSCGIAIYYRCSIKKR